MVHPDQNGDQSMMKHLPDHGLPLIQLKEQRRDLVVALQNRNGPISGWELMQIAAVQQAISAFEEGIADLDAEAEMDAQACPRESRERRASRGAASRSGLQIALVERRAFAGAETEAVAE